MPAPALYRAPPNEYLVQPRLTKRKLLTVFYTHVFDLARLMQASVVPQDLDPEERGEDRWSWSASLPMQVEKLWADLQAVRKQVAASLDWNARAGHARALAAQERRARAVGNAENVREEDVCEEWPADVADEGAQPADKHLVAGCMHLYSTIDELVRYVTPQLARNFVLRLLEIARALPHEWAESRRVLSRNPDVVRSIRQSYDLGEYQHALATYFRAQISEELGRD